MLNLSVNIDTTKLLKHDGVELIDLRGEFSIDSARLSRAKRAKEAARDTKALKNDLRVVVLNSLDQELGNLRSFLGEISNACIFNRLGAEHAAKQAKGTDGRVIVLAIINRLLQLVPNIVE